MTMSNFGFPDSPILRVFDDEALSLGECFAEPHSGFQERFCPVLQPAFFVSNKLAVHVHRFLGSGLQLFPLDQPYQARDFEHKILTSDKRTIVYSEVMKT